MLVVDPRRLERGLVRRLVDLLEDVFEPAVVLLQDRVLRRHELRACACQHPRLPFLATSQALTRWKRNVSGPPFEGKVRKGAE